MRILLFSYWSITEGISRGALFPLLELLEQNRKVDQVFLCTVEPEGFKEMSHGRGKTVLIPLKTRSSTVAKIWNLVRFPFRIRLICEANAVDLIWCKGAPAGGIGALVNLLGRIPFVVDSFEPHSDYMVDSGTWSKADPKFFIQRRLENMAKKRALTLLPGSHHYRLSLINEGVEKDKLFVLPCVAKVSQFSFQQSARKAIREELHIMDNQTVGIYVGKYGGLYYDDEAFSLYGELFRFFGPTFFLILITETDAAAVRAKLMRHRLPTQNIFISKVKHERVSDYLSAADFAISTIKSVPAMRFCSPIKHGEYWSNDLPILSTLSIGDDAEIIRNEEGGVIIDGPLQNREDKMSALNICIRSRGTGSYAKLASKYRNTSIMEDAIEFVIEKWLPKGRQPINERR